MVISNCETTVGFEATSQEQLAVICKALESRMAELDNAFEERDATTEEEMLHASIFNFLCDLEVEGYEI